MNAAPASEISTGGRWVLGLAALMATYLVGVNISIPNAALSYMQGSLSMADDEIGWLFTSYIAAGLIVMPLTPWLASRFGRKAVFQISIVIFAIGLVLDTIATTPIQFVLARIVQGAGSGPLAPISAAILFDIFSPARRARISVALAACGLLGISTGPCVGGWLSEYHGWPSIFYFSLPLAGFVFLAVAFFLPEKKAEQKPSFDFFGAATFTTGMIGLQMLLDRGERLEWFCSKEIWAEATVSATGFYLFFVHILTAKTHFFSKGLLRDRNYLLSTIIYFGVGFVLLPTLALTSPMLEDLLNYPVPTTGYMTIPRGIALVGSLVLTSFVPPRIDSRVLVMAGLALVAYANWRMLYYSPAMDWRPVPIAGALQGAGLGMAILALTKTAFSTLDQKLHPEGNAIFGLMRLYGSALGISVVQIFFYGNTQAMHLALAKDLAPYRAAAHVTGSMARPALARLNDMITGQAALIATIGQFKILLCATLIVSPLVLFLRKPRPAGEVLKVRAMTSPPILLRGQTLSAIMVAISSMVFLSGCTVGPNYKHPADPVSKQYDAQAEKQLGAEGVQTNVQRISLGQKPGSNWWSTLGSTKLDQVMQKAIEGNLDLAAANATIAQATEAIKGAKGRLYPQLDYAGQIGRQRSTSGGTPTPSPGSLYAFGITPSTTSFYAVGPTVSFDFDVFGGTKRLVEQQAALADFQKHHYDAAYLALTGDVANQAILLASARAQIEAVRIVLDDDKKNLELVRLAHLHGSVAEVDVALAQNQLALDQTLLAPLAQQGDVARHALSVLAGKGPADWVPPEFDLADFILPSNLPVSLPSEMAHDRPDILEAEAELHAASAAIGVATADLYPRLTLSGLISEAAEGSSSPFGPSGSLWSIGSGLAGPLFHGGTLKANRRGAIDAFEGSMAIYRKTVINSLGQVADVLQAINHDGEELSAQDQALDAASTSLQLNRAGHGEGEVSVLQVLEAERAYERALLGQIQAKTAQYLDTIQLSVALGGNSTGAFGQRSRPEHFVNNTKSRPSAVHPAASVK